MAGDAAVILMIDDNAGEAFLFQEALEDYGMPHNFHHVEDAESARAFLERTGKQADAPRPDVILLDMKLPGTGGLEVLRRIKADSDLADIPVFMVSTLAPGSDVEEARNLGATGFITKPDNFDGYAEVIDQIRTALENTG